MRPEFVAGFVTAEGTFVATPDGRRFAFTIGVAAADGLMCDRLVDFFGVGRTYRYRRRQEHHQDVAIYTVQSKRELAAVIVPFMDRHLPPSNKRRQYEAWRTKLDSRMPLPQR